MSDNRGSEQGRDPSRPILDDDGVGDAYDNEDEILGDLNGLDELDEDSADLEDFDELEDDEDWESEGDLAGDDDEER